jgi:hypothetical protein
VLSAEQARAVRDEVGAGEGGGAPARGSERRSSSVSPGAEVAGYLGGALALVAVVVLVADRMRDASPLAVAVLLGAMSAVFVVAGFAIRDPDGRDGVRWRLTGTLWSIAVLLAAFATAGAVHDGRSAGTVVTAAGGAALVLAAALYAVQRSAGQVVTLVLAGVATVVGLALVADWEVVGNGLAVAALGGVVMLAGVTGALEPDDASVPLGGALVLVGLQVVSFTHDWRPVVLLLMIGAAVALFVLATRTGVVLSGVATLGLTAALPQAMDEFGGGSAPLPVVLLVTGVALLGGAALTTRMRR